LEAYIFTYMQVLIDTVDAADLAGMFRLLGDPTRVRILFAVQEAGELCVGDIAARVETSETKVSQAMRLLRSANVVRARRDGRNIYYRLDDDHICQLLDVCRDHLSHTRTENGAPVPIPSTHRDSSARSTRNNTSNDNTIQVV
jgi:DNA-binding transcriptional ArsR family regulator